jgi:hypothetical protein
MDLIKCKNDAIGERSRGLAWSGCALKIQRRAGWGRKKNLCRGTVYKYIFNGMGIETYSFGNVKTLKSFKEERIVQNDQIYSS